MTQPIAYESLECVEEQRWSYQMLTFQLVRFVQIVFFDYILYFHLFAHVSTNTCTCFPFSGQNIKKWGLKLRHNILHRVLRLLWFQRWMIYDSLYSLQLCAKAKTWIHKLTLHAQKPASGHIIEMMGTLGSFFFQVRWEVEGSASTEETSQLDCGSAWTRLHVWVFLCEIVISLMPVPAVKAFMDWPIFYLFHFPLTCCWINCDSQHTCLLSVMIWRQRFWFCLIFFFTYMSWILCW